MSVDRNRAERAIREFLIALGYDPSRADLADTPARVAEAFSTELLCGERVDLGELVRSGSEPLTAPAPGLVVVQGIRLTLICPHHLLPALGTATVAYLPGERLLGLGTVARLVETAARRLALQESVGEKVVSALLEQGGARGAFCRLDLLHTCLSGRGGQQPDARLITLSRGGELDNEARLSELSLALGNAKNP